MLLKKITLIILVSLFVIACGDSKKSKVDLEDYRSELRGYAAEFMSELKTVLQKNMKEGGPLQAVSVCSDTAQMLTQKYAENNNLNVKRVSLKNRNSNNIPNDFEEGILTDFENQIYKANHEFIIVDDRSTDSSPDILARYSDKINTISQKHQGLASALNLGISKMNGTWLKWFSPDDIMFSNTIEDLITATKNISDKIIIYSNWQLISENGDVLHNFSELNYNELFKSII